MTDYLDKKLCDFYENECIFDKFDINVSPVSDFVVTGAYNSSVHAIDTEGRWNNTIEVKFKERRGKGVGMVRKYGAPGRKLPAIGKTLDS